MPPKREEAREAWVAAPAGNKRAMPWESSSSQNGKATAMRDSQEAPQLATVRQETAALTPAPLESTPNAGCAVPPPDEGFSSRPATAATSASGQPAPMVSGLTGLANALVRQARAASAAMEKPPKRARCASSSVSPTHSPSRSLTPPLHPTPGMSSSSAARRGGRAKVGDFSNTEDHGRDAGRSPYCPESPTGPLAEADSADTAVALTQQAAFPTGSNPQDGPSPRPPADLVGLGKVARPPKPPSDSAVLTAVARPPGGPPIDPGVGLGSVARPAGPQRRALPMPRPLLPGPPPGAQAPTLNYMQQQHQPQQSELPPHLQQPPQQEQHWQNPPQQQQQNWLLPPPGTRPPRPGLPLPAATPKDTRKSSNANSNNGGKALSRLSKGEVLIQQGRSAEDDGRRKEALDRYKRGLKLVLEALPQLGEDEAHSTRQMVNHYLERAAKLKEDLD